MVLAFLLTTNATGVAVASSGHTFKLIHSWNFASTQLNTDWAVYDTAHTLTPNARVASLVSIGARALHVTAVGDEGSGLCLCRSTGMPTTPYGRWVVRARGFADRTHGFAILLWPNAENWPVGGELDLAEFTGAKPGWVQTTVHYGATNQHRLTFTRVAFRAWHTYSVTWEPRTVTFRIDGRIVLRITARRQIPRGAMHLAIQAGVAQGVRHPTPTVARLDVAWVRFYR